MAGAPGDERAMLESIPPAVEPKRRARRFEPPRLVSVTVGDACQITGLGLTTIYELIGAGTLKTAKVGRRRLVMYASIEALLEQSAA
jgi:excisionase family DNA binding protein